MRQILRAVCYCHSHGVCHRDLKPGNFVYADETPTSQLKMIDFGLSKHYRQGLKAKVGTLDFVAPEIFDGPGYSEKVDMWSVGVIAYLLLGGFLPFYSESNDDLIDDICSGNFTFPDDPFKDVSDLAKEFICKLLVVDSAERLSAYEALQHPWIGEESIGATPQIDLETLRKLRRFAAASPMKRALLGLMAHTGAAAAADSLDQVNQFSRLATWPEGTITFDGFRVAINRHLRCGDVEAERETGHLFRRLDQTGDGEVHYTEFLASTLCVGDAFQDGTDAAEGWLREIFARLDTDGSGQISVDQLRAVLGDHYADTPIEEMVRRLDKGYAGAVKQKRWVKFEDLQREMQEGSAPKKFDKLCDAWRDTGYCERGVNCRFLHPETKRAIGKTMSPWGSQGTSRAKQNTYAKMPEWRKDSKNATKMTSVNLPGTSVPKAPSKGIAAPAVNRK
eukprot:gnl/MRDRNA2_/MRDRNA2_61472_c0_seq1.p1 gnl/MRDRNA2_/MRDRNA2_61472_c0~~gnl/MRDRNA2_/MRDRNA2_61472_c0_seq1.p1  ORF type:complete len:449 (+),score=96.71 gnl/MRDRNA2_/MRDRNA2_61472_c0_seq1:668-2014(+)